MSDGGYFVDARDDDRDSGETGAASHPRGPTPSRSQPGARVRARRRQITQPFGGRAGWVGLAVFGGIGLSLVILGAVLRIGGIAMAGVVMVIFALESRSPQRRRHPGTVEEMLVGPAVPPRRRLTLPTWTLPAPRRNARGRGVEPTVPAPRPQPRVRGHLPLERPDRDERGGGADAAAASRGR